MVLRLKAVGPDQEQGPSPARMAGTRFMGEWLEMWLQKGAGPGQTMHCWPVEGLGLYPSPKGIGGTSGCRIKPRIKQGLRCGRTADERSSFYHRGDLPLEGFQKQ